MNRPKPYDHAEHKVFLDKLDWLIDRVRRDLLTQSQLSDELNSLEPMLFRVASAPVRFQFDSYARSLEAAVAQYWRFRQDDLLPAADRFLADRLAEIQRWAAVLAANEPAFETPVKLADDAPLPSRSRRHSS